MTHPFSQNIWNLSENELAALLDSGNLKPIASAVRFYAPSFTYYKTRYYCSSSTDFPTVSVTGTTCTLKCKHCGGKVLETMHPAISPEKLFRVCTEFKDAGARGCLVSGGCLPDGSVPLSGFVDTLGRIKRELDLTVFVHSGILGKKTAFLLGQTGVDAVLLDVIGSAQTIRRVYNLKVRPQDYSRSMAALSEARVPFVPHVIVGLNMGKLDGELAALQMIRQFNPSALVIIAFMPIRGTAMEKTPPPRPLDIAKTIATARIMFPQTPLVLGCMRPKGRSRDETDLYALKAGVDAIAFPSEQAVKHAENRGFKTSFSSYCCAQIYMDLSH